MILCTFVSFLAFSVTSPVGLLVQEGTASYYSNKFHGRKTTSGEVYKKHLLTAAHATLPFNSRVEITNLSNQKTVVVRINDRMSSRNSKVIDMSYAAAQQIDLIRAGIGRVLIKQLPNEPEISPLPADTLIASEKQG